MKSHKKQTNQKQGPTFQPQKIHIDGFRVMEAVKSYEKDLNRFLSKYGEILDCKVLKNSKLTRRRKRLRFCHLRK